MKYLLIVIIILSSFISNAQNKWNIGIYYQPGMSGLINSYTEVFDETEELYVGPSFSQSAGIKISYKLFPKIQINSGILFKQLTYDWRVERSFYDEQTLESFEQLDPKTADWQKTELKRFDIVYAVPVGINYRILDKKLELYVTANMILNRFSKTKNDRITFYTNETIDENSKFEELNNFRKQYYMSSSAGIGMTFNISEKISVFSESGFEYFFSHTDHNSTPLYGNYFNVILKTGLFYTF